MKSNIIAIALSSFAADITAFPEKLLSWSDWKTKFNKNYAQHEISQKYENFMKTKNFIQNHNERFLQGKETYFTDLNDFSDMSDEEFFERNNYNEATPFGSTYTCSTIFRPTSGPANNCLDCKDNGDGTGPAYFWQDPELNNLNKKLVTDVKDQASCGSCWAFAAAATIEGQFCMKDYYDCNTWQGVSPQNYVDCNMCDDNTGINDLTGFACSFGCGGGWSQNAWYYSEVQGGTGSWDGYPYESGTTRVNGECRYNPADNVFNVNNEGKAIADRCVAVSGKNEETMMQAVNTEGPIKVSIYASRDGFRSYAGGVYSDDGCGQSTNHAVTVTGYGIDSESGMDYWMVKNSWGTSYGLGGYVKMRRNYGSMCAIGSYPYWPLIN